ncbi:homeobox protein 14-like [Lucilia cuprina]|uniref:homeobox protein 14-like n=1 Tax=Lucilia cuprina TaxID=7375 RepID=UPI001F071210|nr:homeobox protein 14-like [Lucilia cuprina]
MESNLNEEKLTVQSLITSVPAASGGEQTGPQSSSSSDCTQPISEVGNLASVIENMPRSNENEEIVLTGQKTDTSLNYETETAENSLQSEPNKKDIESETIDINNMESNSKLLVENNEESFSNNPIQIEENKSISNQTQEESSSQTEPNENDEEPINSKPIQIEDNANNVNRTIGMEDSKESTMQSQPAVNSEETITKSSTHIRDNNTVKKRLSGAQRRKLKKMAMKRQKREAAQAINNNINGAVNDDNNIKCIKENPLQAESKKNDKESQSDVPAMNTPNSALLCKTITNKTIYVDDNKESINESSLQAQPNESNKELGTNKDNTQFQDNTQIDNNTDTTKKRLSGAQRRKLRKLEMMQEGRPKHLSHLRTITSTNTSSEMGPRRLIHIQYASTKESKIAHPKVVVGFFPNSIDDTNDKILSFIQWQNEGLSVFEWKLLRRTFKNSTVMLTLLIDKMSAAKLEEVKGEIYYKFRQIKLHMKDYDEKRDHATNSTESITRHLTPAKMPRIK